MRTSIVRRAALRVCLAISALVLSCGPACAQAPQASTSSPVAAPPPAVTRPAALPALYVTYAALQGLDVHSTLRAVDRGAHESNPLVGPATVSTGALLAVKAGSTAAAIYLTEGLWKKNRKAAILTMIALDSAYVTVVAHNHATAVR